MKDYNDKSETFEFKPVNDEKPQINRRENDVYSSARKSAEYEKNDEGDNRTLVYVAIVLAVLLIVAIVAGIFILKSGNNTEDEPLEQENIIINEQEGEEDLPEEEKEITVECSMIFYADSVIKKNGEYTVLADLYDKDFYKFDNRKLIITNDTLIKEDGKRLSMDALMYLVESMAGEGIVFEGEIREEDNVVLSISFDGSFREEMEEEPQQPEEEPILPGEDPGTEEEPEMGETQGGETQPPAEENKTAETQE